MVSLDCLLMVMGFHSQFTWKTYPFAPLHLDARTLKGIHYYEKKIKKKTFFVINPGAVAGQKVFSAVLVLP